MEGSKRPRKPQIIAVKKSNEGSCRVPNPAVACSAWALVALLHCNHMVGQGLQIKRRSVCRTVIDDNDLIASMSLRPDGFERLLEQLQPVVGWNDDGEI